MRVTGTHSDVLSSGGKCVWMQCNHHCDRRDPSSLDLEEKKNCGSPGKKFCCLILCVNYSEPQDTQGAGETFFSGCICEGVSRTD